MKKILFVSHDASRTGAPMILLHLLKWLKLSKGDDITILLLDGGNMENKFKNIAPVYQWNPFQLKSSLISRIISKILKRNRIKTFPNQLSKQKFDLIYLNTIVTTSVIPKLKQLFNCPILLHVHENEYTVKNLYPKSLNFKYLREIDHYIAVSQSTKENLISNYGINNQKIDIIYEFVPIIKFASITKSIDLIKNELNIKEGEFIIGGAGLTTWRKGIDLFLQIASKTILRTNSSKYKFIWIGEIDKTFKGQLDYELARIGLSNSDIIFTGRVNDPQNYFNILDLFLLSSREDPFPLVCLEAAALGKPIICFENSGGMPEFINEANGATIKYGDVEAASKKIIELANNISLLEAMGLQIKKDIRKFDVNIQAPKIYSIIERLNNK